MNRQDITIPCKDGHELAGTVYRPESPRAAVMIAPATGIKRRFYNAFATHLAERGYGVICFDNRGIGDSVNGAINDVNASLISWGTLDMPAVLRHLQASFPELPYHLVGHSAGGQLVGLMDNAHQLRSLLNFAASSGNLRNMEYPFKLSAYFFMHLFIPLNNLLFGKTHSQWVGMGEPLPKEVARQWRRWCSGRGYLETDFGKNIQTHYYDELSLSSLWLYATDDPIANPKNVRDMVRVYTKSDATLLALDPNTLGFDRIGHMGFFRKKNRTLWKYATDWLDEF